MCFSKLGTFMKKQADIYSNFKPIQLELQELVDLEDVDKFLMKKSQLNYWRLSVLC